MVNFVREMSRVRKQKTFEELLDLHYGAEGSAKRNAFEEKALLFEISEMLKEARKQAGMTQEQLATKLGTKNLRHPDRL